MSFFFGVGQLVKLRMVHARDLWLMWGCLQPQGIYQSPLRSIGDLYTRVSSRTGVVVGLVVRRMDADLVLSIPEVHLKDGRWDIYQVLIGEGPALWFRWSDLEGLGPGDESFLDDPPNDHPDKVTR